MLRGFVLRYLGWVAGGEATESAAARLPAALRRAVVGQAERAVIASRFETEHGGDEGHVHRLAYLRARGRPAIDPNRVGEVKARFDAERDTRAEATAGARLGASLVGVLVLAGGAVAAAVALGRPAPATPPTAAAEPTPATPTTPAEPEHPLTSLFEETVPRWVVALDARSAAREPRPPEDVTSTHDAVLEAAGARADALVPSLGALLTASESFSEGGEPFAEDVWLQRLVDFHDALRAAGLPFYVDGHLTESYGGRRRVLFSTFVVEGTPRFSRTGAEAPITALLLRRLDHLSFVESLLGYTRPEIRYALVLVDRIEGFLVTQHLPSMRSADESVFVRDYTDERDAGWVTDFETWAHEDLAAEAGATTRAAGVPDADLETLLAAVVARRHAIQAMSSSLRDVDLIEPSTLDFDPEQLAAFRDDGNARHLAAIREATAVLARPEVRAAFDAVLAAYVASVARHEVQHRIDYEDDRLFHVPEALADYTGETESEDRVNRRAERANAELSAYLSQIARTPTLARSSLLHVASFLMDRSAWSRPEAYAALVVFESLARAAGIEHGELVVAHRIVRGEVSAIYGALRGRADLAALASQAWTALYDAPLAELTAIAD